MDSGLPAAVSTVEALISQLQAATAQSIAAASAQPSSALPAPSSHIQAALAKLKGARVDLMKAVDPNFNVKKAKQLQQRKKKADKANPAVAAEARVASLAGPSSSASAAASSSSASALRLVCLDVECVATGKGHSDRAPCWVGMYELSSDGSIPQHPLLDLKMTPPTIVDYMTDMSGVTAATLESAVNLEQGLQRARGVLGPQVTLLGWNLQNDIDWLQLKQGVHYREAVDIIDWFGHPETNQQGKTYTRRYPLGHVAATLLKFDVRSNGSHDPLRDARATLELFVKYRQPKTHERSPKMLKQALHKVRQAKVSAAYRSVTSPTVKGVCRSAYDPAKCTCGQPTKRQDEKEPSALVASASVVPAARAAAAGSGIQASASGSSASGSASLASRSQAYSSTPYTYRSPSPMSFLDKPRSQWTEYERDMECAGSGQSHD